jgi:hypothetical protein
MNQTAGKRKALEEIPRSFSNEMLMMVGMDDTKSINEVEFNEVLIWIRVTKLPIRLFTKEAAEAIGNEVGVFLEVEEDNGGVLVGNFL